MSDDNLPLVLDTSFQLFNSEDGKTRIAVRFEGESVWLSQKALAELYGKDVRTINEHIKNIFEEKELSPEATIRNFRIVQNEGARQISRSLDHYNLEMIMAVGCRLIYMKDWRAKLDTFLRFNERDVLDDPGKVSMEVAKALAEERYEAFNSHRLTQEAIDEEKEDIKKLESYHD